MTKFVSLSRRMGITLTCVMMLGGCDTLTSTEGLVLGGGAVGVGVGAGVTVLTGGCLPCGMAIGGAAGSGVGYLYHFTHRTVGR